ncbi:MAG: hypothetical protein R2712_30755 [Vicinamibacterales bacterium]
MLGGAVLAIVLGVILEGVIVGMAQGRVLARHTDRRRGVGRRAMPIIWRA